MQTVIGIDPGPTESAVVVLNGDVVGDKYEERNGALAVRLATLADQVAIEDFVGYGKSLAWESIETIKWIGIFRHCAANAIEISRPDVKRHLCGVTSVGDPAVSDALCRRWGSGGRKAAVGTKTAPGPLHGIKGHLWAALAVAVTAADRAAMERPNELG